MQPSRLALLFCVTFSMWGTWGSAANIRDISVVQSIEVTPEQVTIHLSSASVYTQAALPKDSAHQRTDRCYVDVSGVLGQQLKRLYAGNAQHVQQVRVAQFQPQTVRVVLDLSTAQPCQVKQAFNPDRLQIIVGRSKREENTVGPPTQAIRQEPAAEQPSAQTTRQEPARQEPAQQEVAAEQNSSSAPEYLDLRTPFSPRTQQANPVSLFGQQVIEDKTPQLSLFGQQAIEDKTPQLSLFGQQAIEDQAPGLAPSGLYLLQETGQE